VRFRALSPRISSRSIVPAFRLSPRPNIEILKIKYSNARQHFIGRMRKKIEACRKLCTFTNECPQSDSIFDTPA
jgi:hypothetical protein